MSTPDALDISFVVIGYNEGRHIRACLESVRACTLPSDRFEVLYVDGGSTDDSAAQARSVPGVTVLGGDERRRAAQNRNLGARHARGRYIQFLDGDMVLEPDWPAAGLSFLDAHTDVAVVSGALAEMQSSLVYRVLELDWNPAEGEADTCGGAAIYRRDAFAHAGGFPEDVTTGEEPLLCWRIRNQVGQKVWYLDRPMARHDLGYRGLRDYWRRCVTNGRAYIEIASRCWNSPDPFWSRNVIRNFAWAAVYLALILALVFGPAVVKAGILVLAVAVIGRLAIKTRLKGHPWSVAVGYAVHCYFAKIPLAWGQLRWLLFRR